MMLTPRLTKAYETSAQAAPGIRSSVLGVVVEALDALGSDADALLTRHALDRSTLADPYNVVSLRRYIAFFEDASTHAADAAMGMRLGAAIKPEQIGPVGVLFVMVPCLRVGLSKLAQFFPALQGRTRLSFDVHPEYCVCNYVIEDLKIWPRRQDSEFTMALICALIRSRLGAHWVPEEVHFEHPAPEDAREIQRFFKSIVRFEQAANRIIIHERDLDRPFPSTSQAAISIIEQHLSDLIGDNARGGDIEEIVGDAILRCMKHGSVNLEEVSARMGIGVRTLQRQLAQRGLSFRDLVRSRREDAAKLLLSGDRCSLGLIARNLGYADVSAMSRAFKSWTGISPRSYAKMPGKPRP